MSGIAGIVNLRRRIDSEVENMQHITDTLKHRGQCGIKIKNAGNAVFGCANFEYFENKDRQMPITQKIRDTHFTICFDGLIYNSSELSSLLKADTQASDAELVLCAYIKWGAGCLQRLNGIFSFAIWNDKGQELFLARDRFGIKPLYYAYVLDCFIFSSEIKGILTHPDFSAELDKTGICEVMGLGPAQTAGCGVFCGINEVKPAFCMTYNQKGLYSSKYWGLTSASYLGSFEDCLEETKELVFGAINSQLDKKGRDMCFFLSGGLDSSIITALAAQKYGDGINTYSLHYRGNDEYFSPTEYQPNSDDYFINLMSETFKTNHHMITVDTQALCDLLYDSMKARDFPGMGDVDSSLYYLCSKMAKSHNGAVSGECADEIFGGYPWFHRKEDFDADIFPWAKNIDFRKSLISPEIISPNEISDYIYSAYKYSVAETPRCRLDSAEEARRREISHLNKDWFMYTLGARSERIGMNTGLEIRMPFCEQKLVEFMWNVPWGYKAYDGREKGLLRMAFDGILPDEILWRKKSPFPKTHNPEYELIVKNGARQILDDKNSPVSALINRQYVLNLMEQPSDYGKPWFGQLMATPQLYAYIIQLDMWLREYNIKIKI